MPLTFTLTPLPLLKRQDGTLLRYIQISASANPVQEASQCVLEIRHAGTTQEWNLGPLHDGENNSTIFLPEPAEESTAEAVLRYGDQREVRSLHLRPARRWTVHLILHSHTDLGFTDPISTVARIHSENTDRAIELCHETAGWPDGARFKWTCEVAWQVQQYAAARPPERVAELMRLIREDSIAVGALYAGELTDILGHEEAVRSLYYASHLRRRYGIPCDTALLCDVPGCTAGFIQIMAKAGIDKFILADNNFIAPVLARTDLPRPFWWNGADETRVLCWYTDHPFYAYIEGECYGLTQDVQSVAAKLSEKLISLEAGGYQFDHVQFQYAFDNALLNTRPLEVVREWNSVWEYPKIRLSTARECLAHLQAAHADQIPVRSGDWTNWWAGIVTEFPRETALTRKCHERTPAAELLWTAVTLHDPSYEYPGKKLTGVYDGLLGFDEHSGGGTLWNPKTPEEQEQAVREGYGLIHDAAATLTTLETAVSGALSSAIDNPAGANVIAVMNPTSAVRSGIVRCTATAPEGPAGVVDQAAGKGIPAVMLPGHSLVFRAAEVPPYGYKTYRLVPRAAVTGAGDTKATARADENGVILENRHVRLVIDRQTGCCSSLHAMAAQHECVHSGGQLNRALVYVSHPVKQIELGKYIPEIYVGVESPGETMPWPTASKALVEFTKHPVMGVTCRVSHAIEGRVWLTQEYQLQHEDAGVYVTNILRRTVRDDQRLAAALAGFLKNEGVLYFAFPFNVPDAVFEYEAPASVLCPSTMQFKGSCDDYFAIQRWCRIAGSDLSIAVAAPDTPLVDVGSIGLLRFKPALDANQSALYFRGVTLREWGSGKESPFSKGEDLTFRFGIDVSRLDGEDAVTIGRSRAHTFGLAMHAPLTAINVPPNAYGSYPATSHSWCSITPANVELMTLKEAEIDGGQIVRVRETLGVPVDARIQFPGFRITTARKAMITEEPLEPVRLLDNAISVHLAPFAIHTFLVILASEGEYGRDA